MYEELKTKFTKQYQKDPDYIFSAPGRTEIGGNHTDHQHGCVLAGAVNRETVAAVKANNDYRVRIDSEGYPFFEVDLSDLTVHDNEKATSVSVVRGIAARLKQLGHEVCGFDACVTSEVPAGSGLSSSAAFEVLIGTIFNELCDCGLSPELIAQIGQYAENNYFGKPCGLMDQTASACGNIITIDFKDPSKPIIKPVKFDFATSGYALCIIDTGANHADLTDDYAGITIEMKQIASHFNKEVLRDVDESDFYDRLKELRESYGDRACLRAIHFFNEQRRVAGQVKALEENDFAAFLDLIKESGRSSWMMLQNVIPAGSIQHQNVALALALVEKLLSGKGAFRVHGGGFAGTIQAFVPNDIVDTFVKEVDKVLGEGSCQIMSIRNTGGGLVEDCHL